MKKKIIAAALAAAVLLAAGGLLFGLHRIGETTISAGPEPAAPEEVQPAEPEEPSVPEQPEKEPEEAEPVQTQTPVPEAVQTEKPCIVIDAGHQLNADYGKEPVGPGSTELKTRVSAGTTGVSTGIPEYELNLAVSLLLQQELTARGYTVVMTRTENDVSISNAERAQIANTQQAGAFIRVHANASESAAASGIMTICMTPSNPYNGALYEKSRALSDCVLERLGAALDKPQNERTLWQTDTMTGINYSEVPVTIVEMGFMTNPAEDEAMATDAYRAKIAAGIADGVDAYFRRLQRQSLTEDAALAEALREQLQGSSDKWDIWAERLQEGTYAHVQENIDPDAPQMVSASLIKLFIMGAVYDAERSGTLTPGAQEDAICQMISVSDNAAANELTCLLGGGSEADGRAAVERFAASIDCTAVRYNRLMLVENGTQNYVNAEDCAAFLRLVYNRQCVSQEASEQMLAHLLAQQVNDRIPQGLPEGTQCAHKTGDLLGLCCADVGIVFTRRRISCSASSATIPQITKLRSGPASPSPAPPQRSFAADRYFTQKAAAPA